MNTRQYIFLGAIGAICFVISFGLGSSVVALTGIPLMGGLVHGIITGIVLTAGLKSVPKFGAAVVIWIVFSVLAIPTITLGTPGVYKVVVGIVVGLIWDIVIILFRRRDIGYILGSIIGGNSMILGTFLAAVILGLPAVEKLRSTISFLLITGIVIQFLTGWLGVLLYRKKLSGLSLFKRLAE